jgi:hypothetical protein
VALQPAARAVDIAATITAVRSFISDARISAHQMRHDTARYSMSNYEDSEVIRDGVAGAYEHLLLLAEALGMTDAASRISSAYKRALKQENGLARVSEEPYGTVPWEADTLSLFADGIETVFGLKTNQSVSKDLVSILRATQYAITDSGCFFEPPQNEADVHHRVEAVLRCVFPDLRSKLPVSKPIKNFEPDTGLPSVKTLVEYKFVESIADVKRVADEILADTRGYVSADWNNFVFLIYETNRLKSETEWNNLLHDCGTAANTQAIVICGETTRKTKSKAMGGERTTSSEKASPARRKPRRKSEGGR